MERTGAPITMAEKVVQGGAALSVTGGSYSWLGTYYQEIGAVCAIIGAVCSLVGLGIVVYKTFFK